MIVFNIVCKECSYSFEGWFENSNEFTKQKKRNLVLCPSCNSNNVNKGLMAPNVGKKTNSKNQKIKTSLASNIKKLKKIIKK